MPKRHNSGIDYQAAPVQASFGLNPYANTLFLFCGKHADRIKALYGNADGFVLLYKRPERGICQWLRMPAEVRELTHRQLRWLQEGLAIHTAPKAAMGRAAAHAQEQWPYLIHYLPDGRPEISNNRAERSIKPFATGRKNFRFVAHLQVNSLESKGAA